MKTKYSQMASRDSGHRFCILLLANELPLMLMTAASRLKKPKNHPLYGFRAEVEAASNSVRFTGIVTYGLT